MSVSTSADFTLDASQTCWAVLAGQLDAFLRAWEAGAPPNLTTFVPSELSPTRRLVLTELIKADLEQRAQRGCLQRLEAYLHDFPELADGGVPVDLIYEEFLVRKRTGELVDPSEYAQRFPDRADELARLIGLGQPLQSTAMFRQAPPEELQAGQQIDDFDLLLALGKGAFAQVFLARQRSMARLVALKASADRGAEAQALAQLDHPNIVRVFDQRLLPERGLRLLYMNYVPGGTLSSALERLRATPPEERSGRTLLQAVDTVLKDRGIDTPQTSELRRRIETMTWPQVVCWLGARLAEALAYAHRQGVLHRDIKPANVLLTSEGAPRLADFNVGSVSKVDGAGPAAFFGGSLAYMSPEQMEAFNPAHPRSPASVDGQSDVYSLGITLWELLSGQRPFADERIGARHWSETLAALTQRRREGIPADALASLPAHCPEGLKELLCDCLQPEAADRPDAAELARQLDLCLMPATRRLLRPRPGNWRDWCQRHPILACLAFTLPPSVVATGFNILLNRANIVEPLAADRPEIWPAFVISMLIVNTLMFPVGITLAAWTLVPVAHGIQRMRSGQLLPIAEASRLRSLALSVGRRFTLIVVGCWAASGPMFPLVIHLVAGSMPVWAYVSFFGSLALCGLMAATLPFFGVSFLAVRVFYPALWRPEISAPADWIDLSRLGRSLGVYLAFAGAVPLLAVLTMALVGAQDRLALAFFSGAGLVGFAAAFVLAQRTQADLTALRPAVKPGNDALGSVWSSFGRL